MGESAEDLLAADPALGEVDRLGRTGACLSRGELAEATVRPGGVAVLQVLGQHLADALADERLGGRADDGRAEVRIVPDHAHLTLGRGIDLAKVREIDTLAERAGFRS